MPDSSGRSQGAMATRDLLYTSNMLGQEYVMRLDEMSKIRYSEVRRGELIVWHSKERPGT